MRNCHSGSIVVGVDEAFSDAVIDDSVALHDVGESRDGVLRRLSAGEAVPARIVARFEGLRVSVGD